jgi:hypothetical protein
MDNALSGNRPVRRIATAPAGRGAFTLMETIIAASITALVATAGTSLIFAAASGTTQTRGLRSTKSMGQYALSRIGRTIRESRAIGTVTSTSVTLWANDINQDDVVNAGELKFINYDASAKKLSCSTLDPDSGINPALVIPQSTFVDSNQLSALVPDSAKIAVVWADGIESLQMTGYPSLTDTRIVGTRLTIGTGAEEIAYQTTASPRASADYLFVPEAVLPPAGPSGRQLRRTYSRWDGFGDILGVLPLSLPLSLPLLGDGDG